MLQYCEARMYARVGLGRGFLVRELKRSPDKDFTPEEMNFSTLLARARNKHCAINPICATDTSMHLLCNDVAHCSASVLWRARAKREKPLTPKSRIFTSTNSSTASHHWLTPSVGSAACVLSMHGLVLPPALSVALLEPSEVSSKIDVRSRPNAWSRASLSSSSTEASLRILWHVWGGQGTRMRACKPQAATVAGCYAGASASALQNFWRPQYSRLFDFA